MEETVRLHIEGKEPGDKEEQEQEEEEEEDIDAIVEECKKRMANPETR